MALEISDNRTDDHPASSDCVFADFVELLDHRRRKLLRIAQRITGDWDEAEDIVQDSAVKALGNLHRFRAESRLGTWFSSVVVNTAIDHLRRRHRRCNESLDEKIQAGEQFEGERTTWRDPEWCYAREELHQLLVSEIEQLRPNHRAVIRLCCLEGYSYTEAADILKVSVSTVKERLHRGRKTLRCRLYERMDADTFFHHRLVLDLGDPGPCPALGGEAGHRTGLPPRRSRERAKATS